MRPAKGLGALECLRLGFAGAGGVGGPGLDPVTCNMTKSHTRANKASWYSILKFFQVDITDMFRMTSSARYFKAGVGSSRPN